MLKRDLKIAFLITLVIAILQLAIGRTEGQQEQVHTNYIDSLQQATQARIDQLQRENDSLKAINAEPPMIWEDEVN